MVAHQLASHCLLRRLRRHRAAPVLREFSLFGKIGAPRIENGGRSCFSTRLARRAYVHSLRTVFQTLDPKLLCLWLALLGATRLDNLSAISDLVYFGIDWPLIVVPRQVSLLFALGGAYFLRKIVKRFTQNEAICATAALIYLLFPAIAFFHAIRHRHRDFVPVDPERVSAVARQSIIIPGLGACSDSPCRGWGRQAQRAAHRSIPVSDHRQASHRKTCLAHARHSVRVGLIVRRNTDPFD